MPFTFAHPAAVLPLTPWSGRWLVFSALAVGAMAPDFGYLFPGGYVHSRTHTLLSLLWFSLPAGLLVWWLFQVVAKAPLIALAPAAWRAKLAPLSSPHAAVRGRGLPGVVLSVLIGAVSHQLIDSATHGTGALVEALPFLNRPVVSLGGRDLSAYKVLQHGLSLIGLGALAWCAWRWFRRAPDGADLDALPPVARATKALVWVGLVSIPLATASVSFGLDYGHRPLYLAVGYSMVAGMGAIGAELLVLGLAFKVAPAWRRERRTQ